MPRVTEEKVWAGTEASLHAALDAEEARATRMAAGERLATRTGRLHGSSPLTMPALPPSALRVR